jgi:tetratricopeptide (TPR) repeat protein
LVPILARTAPVLSTEALIQSVIPPDAEVLYEAFVQLDKANPRGEGHDRCLIKALEILKDSSPESSRFLLEARIQAGLRRVDAAIHAYQHALTMRPERIDWRYELSQYLTAAGKLGEARSELLTLLSLSPSDARARDLYDAVIREIAAKEHPQ